MRYAKMMVASLTVMLAVACQPRQSDIGSSGSLAGAPKGQPAPSHAKDVLNVPENNPSVPGIEPPSPDQVIYFIYNIKGDGSFAYEVENGSWGNYWYGHAYTVEGARYFTGFVYQTPEKYGNEDDSPDPDTKASITQATFVRAENDADKPWNFVGAERYIGEFGGFEKGNTVDADAPLQTYLTPAGNYMLAVPTWSLEAGVRLKTSELFVRNHEDKRWKYVGSIATGDDNGAACASDADPEGLPPCVKSTGTLVFQSQSGSDLPLIRVEMAGTTVDSPGKTRRRGLQDTVEYRYQPEKSIYRIVDR